MLRAAHAMRNPSVRTTEFQYSSFPPSAPPHDNDTDPIPSSTLHAFRRRVLQWNDAYISGVKCIILQNHQTGLFLSPWLTKRVSVRILFAEWLRGGTGRDWPDKGVMRPGGA